MKNRLVQIALTLVLLGLLVQIVLIAPKQIRDGSEREEALLEQEARQTPAADNDVDQSAYGMHTIETQEGRKEFELWADKATSMKSKDVLELEKVKTIFFSESGVSFTVTGQHGHVEVKTKNMRIEGNVVTRSSNGYIFKTASMEYDSKLRYLTAANKVEMFGPNDSAGHSLHLTGLGMKASVLNSDMEILNDVHAEKGLDGGRTVFIRSRRSFFNGKDKSARFVDEVILDMDSMRITGPEARFEYDSQRDLIKSVYVSGGSRVSDPDKWATSQNVSVDFETNRFVFRGDPRVMQNNDELRGEEIVFLDGGKQVEVRNARARVDEKRLEKKK